jgi:hypothetical protein
LELLEQLLLYLEGRYHPSAFLIQGGFGELGALETQKAGIDVSIITVPIVHMAEAAFLEIEAIAEQLGGTVNITITEDGENPYRNIRASWFYPFMASAHRSVLPI